jgi:hypothetical protein
MVAELHLLSSINLFEHLIERALRLHLLPVLNISANDPSRTPADEFNRFDVKGASPENAGGAGTSADRAAQRPLRTDPVVDREILLPDNCVVMVRSSAAPPTLASTHH